MTTEQSKGQPKKDSRPQRYGWAPGKYLNKCQMEECCCTFIGDKRAYMCADCAYAKPDHIPDARKMVPTLSEERLSFLRKCYEHRNDSEDSRTLYEMDLRNKAEELLRAAEMAQQLERDNRTLHTALQNASNHLDYCGYGDAWERQSTEELHCEIVHALSLLPPAPETKGGES